MSKDEPKLTLKPFEHKRKEDSVIRSRQTEVLRLHAAGKTNDEIAAKLGMMVRDVTKDIDSAIDRLIRHYAASPQTTFIRYAVFQFDIINKLRNLSDNFLQNENTIQYSAAVSALRVQSDTYDKILEKGVEYGVVQRKQASKSIRQEPKDLRKELRSEITILTRLLDEIDDPTQAKGIRSKREKYTVIIRKPLRNAYGIVRATTDWKYRRELAESLPDGTCPVIYKQDMTPEQKEKLQKYNYDPEAMELHEALLMEERHSSSVTKEQQPRARYYEEVVSIKTSEITQSDRNNDNEDGKTTKDGKFLIHPSRRNS